jgi:biotin operon repressor
MSTIVMSACWPLALPPTAKAVLISLADNANDHGSCWPSIPTIAERTCLSERAVHAAIKTLEAHGVVTANRSNGRHTSYTVAPQNHRTSCATASPAPPQLTSKPPQMASKPPQLPQSPPQQLRSNHQELKATKSKELRPQAALPDPPDWIHADAWAGFVENRRHIKFPMTERAATLVIRELEKLRAAGADPNTILDQSTRNGWRDVFPIRQEKSHASNLPGGKDSLAQRIWRKSADEELRDRAQRHGDADVVGAHGLDLPAQMVKRMR